MIGKEHVDLDCYSFGTLQALQVKVPKGHSAALYQLLADHCGSSVQATQDASLSDVQVSSKSMGKPWKTVKGQADVLKTLADSSKKGRELLPADAMVAAEVHSNVLHDLFADVR